MGYTYKDLVKHNKETCKTVARISQKSNEVFFTDGTKSSITGFAKQIYNHKVYCTNISALKDVNFNSDMSIHRLRELAKAVVSRFVTSYLGNTIQIESKIDSDGSTLVQIRLLISDGATFRVDYEIYLRTDESLSYMCKSWVNNNQLSNQYCTLGLPTTESGVLSLLEYAITSRITDIGCSNLLKDTKRR